MKKITFLGVIMLLMTFGAHAQYNYFTDIYGDPSAAGQHGDIVLGDVDNDGDLDVFIGGEQRNDPHAQIGGLYINDGKGVFTKKDCPAMPGFRANAAFGDIDGDGDLDLIFSGHKNINILEENARGIALNDGAGNFTIADPTKYPGLKMLSPSVCFADFNNDGLLDYMIAAPDEQSHGDWETNTTITYYGHWSIFYQQRDGSFIEDSSVFQNYFRDQVVSVGDFDNDGDVDVFLQGYYPALQQPEPFGLTGGRWITEIFANDGTGKFSILQGTGFPNSGLGAHDWGDLDGNGFLDVIFIGDGHFMGDWAGNLYHRIFTNNNMVFSDVFTSPKAGPYSYQGSEVLQDLDNDGNLDILLGGWNSDIGRQKTYVYKNIDSDNNFTVDDMVENTFLSDQYLPGFSEQDFEVGDLNGDSIPDFVYIGFKGNSTADPPADKLDVNLGGWTPGVSDLNNFHKFEQLSAPQNLNTTIVGTDTEKRITFSWSAPENIGTKKSVTYNLALKDKTTGKWLYSPMAIIGGEKDGFRQVNRMGNVYLNKRWTLTLPNGEYEWTVQAVDGARFGGKFAATQTLSVSTGVNDISLFKPIVSSSKGQIKVQYGGNEELTLKVYSITGAELLGKKFSSSISFSIQSGIYVVEINGKAGSYKTKVVVK